MYLSLKMDQMSSTNVSLLGGHSILWPQRWKDRLILFFKLASSMFLFNSFIIGLMIMCFMQFGLRLEVVMPPQFH